MIDKKSRRVLIINNLQSDTIDQAIFILKSASKDAGADIAREAQMIIDNYVHRVEEIKERKQQKPASKRRFRPTPLFFGLLIASAILVMLFLRLT